jgi:hypothetical protein
MCLSTENGAAMSPQLTIGLQDPVNHEFLLKSPVFVVAPYPRPDSDLGLVRSILRGTVSGPDETTHCFVAVFTNAKLPEHFAERQIGETAFFKPLTFANPKAFAMTIVDLAALGETHVGVNPGTPSFRRIDFHSVIDTILGNWK